MKVGDLIMYDGITDRWCVEDLWIVLEITKDKKTWHRKILLYNSGGRATIKWKDKHMFRVIR